MAIGWQEEMRPGVALRQIVQQATAALVAMDAERLEELALCCADLNRDVLRGEAVQAREASQAGAELGLFQRILEETRANLTVLTRLHTIRLREAYWMAGKSANARRGNPETEGFGLWKGRERRSDYGDN